MEIERTKSLKELGEEYLTRCEILEKRIRELRKKAKDSPESESALIMRRAYSLYSDLRRCRETAVKMINYYNKENPTDNCGKKPGGDGKNQKPPVKSTER